MKKTKSLLLIGVLAIAMLLGLMFAFTGCGGEDQTNNNQANNNQTNNNSGGGNGGNTDIALTAENVAGNYVVTTITYTPDAEARADCVAAATPSATCTREQWYAGVNDDSLFDIFEDKFDIYTVRANGTIHINGWAAENQATWAIEEGALTYGSIITGDDSTYTVAWDNGKILVTMVNTSWDTSGTYVLTLEKYNATLLTPTSFNGEWAVVSAKFTPDGDTTTYSCTRAQYFEVKGKIQKTEDEQVLMNMFDDSVWASYWFLNSPSGWYGRIYTEETTTYTIGQWAEWGLYAAINNFDKDLARDGWTNATITYTSEGNIVITGTVVGEGTIELTLQKVVAQA